eukprot:1136530-Pelagomonas_calceolata.AAC.5
MAEKARKESSGRNIWTGKAVRGPQGDGGPPGRRARELKTRITCCCTSISGQPVQTCMKSVELGSAAIQVSLHVCCRESLVCTCASVGGIEVNVTSAAEVAGWAPADKSSMLSFSCCLKRADLFLPSPSGSANPEALHMLSFCVNQLAASATAPSLELKEYQF